MHGFKQAPRAWFHKFSSFLILSHAWFYLSPNQHIHVYSQGTTTMILFLYVDDIILIGSSSSVCHSFIFFTFSPACYEGFGWPTLIFRVFKWYKTPRACRWPNRNMFMISFISSIYILLNPFIPISLPRTSLTLTDRELLANPFEYRSMVGAL